MKNIFDFSGKVAVVSGAAGDIGSSIAIALAEAGADLVVADISFEKLHPVLEEIRAKGRTVKAFNLDVTDENSIRRMVEGIEKEFQHIDILVNSAGLTIKDSAESFPIENWQKVMDINVRGTFICCQAIGRVMIRQQGGTIINLSSVRGRYGLHFGQAAYCSSKGAVDNFTRTLACEWAKYNIRVNALAPTLVEGELSRSVFEDPQAREAALARIPLGRFAKTMDIAGAALFLSSSAADFITGQILYIDGGQTASV